MERAPERFARVVYDGECPFCSRYVDFMHLREKFDTVELVDARTRPDLVNHYTSLGYDIDGGMIVDIDDEIYYGADAMWVINDLLSQRATPGVFRRRRLLRRLYPALRFARNTTLRLLGRRKIAG